MNQDRQATDPRVAAWWDAVVAGDTDEPHPIHGHHVSTHLRDGVLVLSGELVGKDDRDQLVRQARARIGRGLRDVDTSKLRLADNSEVAGVLEQTLVAAYPDIATARRAGKYVVEHSRAQPKEQAVLGRETTDLRRLLPTDFIADARHRLARGESLLVLRVDETEAYRVRELMQEDTRSTWTIATPPRRPEAVA